MAMNLEGSQPLLCSPGTVSSHAPGSLLGLYDQHSSIVCADPDRHPAIQLDGVTVLLTFALVVMEFAVFQFEVAFVPLAVRVLLLEIPFLWFHLLTHWSWARGEVLAGGC